jgi:hypothetical protein
MSQRARAFLSSLLRSSSPTIDEDNNISSSEGDASSNAAPSEKEAYATDSDGATTSDEQRSSVNSERSLPLSPPPIDTTHRKSAISSFPTQDKPVNLCLKLCNIEDFVAVDNNATSFSAFVRIMDGTEEIFRTPDVTGQFVDDVHTTQTSSTFLSSSAPDILNEELLFGEMDDSSHNNSTTRLSSSSSSLCASPLAKKSNLEKHTRRSKVRWNWDAMNIMIVELDPLLLSNTYITAELWRGGVLRNSLIGKCRISLRSTTTSGHTLNEKQMIRQVHAITMRCDESYVSESATLHTELFFAPRPNDSPKCSLFPFPPRIQMIQHMTAEWRLKRLLELYVAKEEGEGHNNDINDDNDINDIDDVVRLPLGLAHQEMVHEHVERCCYNDESGYVHGSLMVTSERIVFIPEETQASTVACVSIPLRAIGHVHVQRNELYTTLHVCEKMKAARTFRTVIELQQHQNHCYQNNDNNHNESSSNNINNINNISRTESREAVFFVGTLSFFRPSCEKSTVLLVAIGGGWTCHSPHS